MALIMIADDVPAIVELLSTLLKTRGHQTVSVSDGVQLVEKAKSWRPHLIVTDLMMPGAYGSAAYKSLLEDPTTAQTPVVFLTAVPPEKARAVVPQAPNVRLLFKPLDVPVFLAVVQELLTPLSKPPAPPSGPIP